MSICIYRGITYSTTELTNRVAPNVTYLYRGLHYKKPSNVQKTRVSHKVIYRGNRFSQPLSTHADQANSHLEFGCLAS